MRLNKGGLGIADAIRTAIRRFAQGRAVIAICPFSLRIAVDRPGTTIMIELDTARQHIVTDVVLLRPTLQVSKTEADPRNVVKEGINSPIYAILAAGTSSVLVNTLGQVRI